MGKTMARRTATRQRAPRSRRSAGSAGAGPTQHGRDGSEKDRQIQPEAPFVDVLEVETHPVLEIDVAPASDLPQAGDPGLHRQTAAVPARNLPLFVDGERAGAH